jgi:hypothetical protein
MPFLILVTALLCSNSSFAAFICSCSVRALLLRNSRDKELDVNKCFKLLLVVVVVFFLLAIIYVYKVLFSLGSVSVLYTLCSKGLVIVTFVA